MQIQLHVQTPQFVNQSVVLPFANSLTHSPLFGLFVEEDLADAWKCLLEHHVHAIKQSVRYDNLALVGVHHNSTVFGTFLFLQEHGLANVQLTFVDF